MRANGEGKPVIAVDIDGTLADYHFWFLKFAELYLGKPMPSASEINPALPLYRHMGISKPAYRETKLAYRQGGMKRSMPILPGSADLAEHIRRPATWLGMYGSGLGCELWICTTRPYLRLDNIDPDTREWLRRNRIKYDALLFDPAGGERKYSELMRQAGKRVVAGLDDLPAQITRGLAAGVPYMFLRDQPYNQHYQDVPRWGRGEQAYWYLQEALGRWKDQRHKEAGR